MKRFVFFVAFAVIVFCIYRMQHAEKKEERVVERYCAESNSEFLNGRGIDVPELKNSLKEDSHLVAQADFIQSFPVTAQSFIFPEPLLQSTYKSPMLAATFAIVPGLGHVYLNDMKTAGSLLASATLGAGLYFVKSDQVYFSGLIGFQTTEFYGVYAAYRDARMRCASSYNYPMPTEQLADLAYAPFQWSVLKKPEVWGGILGAAAVSFGAIYLARSVMEASLSGGMPYLALPIGIGEEAFFRGFLQSALAEKCTPWGGITLSSLVFGAAHIPNGFDLDKDDRFGYYAFGIPQLVCLGTYFGWLTYKNNSLKQSVAVHTWYDFIIMTTSFVLSRRAAIGDSGFALSIPF